MSAAIKTEVENIFLGAIPDVYCREAVWEVETLFEVGKYGGDPIGKIKTETVAKVDLSLHRSIL